MRVAQLILITGAAVGLFAMPMGRGASEAAETTRSTLDQPAHDSAKILLTLHNREREHLGLAPLKWSPVLADEASQWAAKLARTRQLSHSGGGGRMGENLWMGTQGVWNPKQMLGFFLAEKRNFRDAQFPHVSRTGNWTDVGHYTQIVWRDTREVGCAVASANRVDVLVCRYYPAGNVVGRSPY